MAIKRISIIYIISNINKAIAFEWLTLQLPKEKFKLSFLLLNPSPSDLESFLINNNVPVLRIPFHGRRSYPSTLFGVIRYLIKQKPDIIHCHLFDASFIGLLAAKLLGIRKRITTRHHSTYNQQYNRKGIKYDKLINRLASDIIAISENVQHVLIHNEKVSPHKIQIIHHGFDLLAFENVDEARIKEIRQKYNPKKKGPVIGVIARWIEWKGIQYIISAFKKLLIDYPDALLVLANANGPYKNEIEAQVSELPKNSYQIIPFENDLFALYQLFDVYVHTPIDTNVEAFGQTYIEAMAAGIPSVFTRSGVAVEYIKHEHNALVVPFCVNNPIYKSIIRILREKELAKRIVENGKKDVRGFDLPVMIKKLEQLYSYN